MSKVLRFGSIDDLPPQFRELARARMADGTPVPVRAFSNPPSPGTNWVRDTFVGNPPCAGERYYRGEKPSEHDEQVKLFKELGKLADVSAHYALAFERTFAVPNGGKRSKGEGGKLKAEGVKTDIPDICCLLPIGRLHGLVIEMKSLTGDPSRGQREFLNQSTDLGYGAACCRGWQQALLVWTNYVDGDQ